MSELLSFDSFSLLPQGSTLSLALSVGQSLCILGPNASGKSRLVQAILGNERARQGTLQTTSSTVCAEVPRRATPQSIAKKHASSTLAAELLTLLRLSNVRQIPVAELSPGQQAAAALIAVLSGSGDLMVVDGALDQLDGWALRTVLARLNHLVSKGRGLVVATNRTDFLHNFDLAIVMVDSQVRFAGPPSEMLRNATPSEIVVSTINQPGVKALVAPFRVSLEDTDDGMLLRAEEGQKVAASLLMEGYGDISFLVLKQRTLPEALLEVID